MASKYVKRYAISLIIRELQIKPAMRYHLLLARMTTIIKQP